MAEVVDDVVADVNTQRNRRRPAELDIRILENIGLFGSIRTRATSQEFRNIVPTTNRIKRDIAVPLSEQTVAPAGMTGRTAMYGINPARLIATTR